MSDIEKYRQKLSEMTPKELQEELDKAIDQILYAKGEEGYWGGVSKREMIQEVMNDLYFATLDDVIKHLKLDNVKKYVDKQIEIRETEAKLRELKRG